VNKRSEKSRDLLRDQKSFQAYVTEQLWLKLNGFAFRSLSLFWRAGERVLSHCNELMKAEVDGCSRRLQDAPAVSERRSRATRRRSRDTRQTRQRRVHDEQLDRLTRADPLHFGVGVAGR